MSFSPPAGPYVGAINSASLWEAFVLLSFTVTPDYFHSEPTNVPQELSYRRRFYTPGDAAGLKGASHEAKHLKHTLDTHTSCDAL